MTSSSKTSIPAMLKKAHQLPATPGVYMMRAEDKEILYIGKAKCLKQRVSSYFRPAADHARKIALMVRKVRDIEIVETESEVEALMLEAKMIWDLKPKYNTRQKDDKSYPFIAISKERFPRVMIARKQDCQPNEDYEWFGPYVDQEGLHSSFRILQNIFRFRTCDLDIEKTRKRSYRPCLLASIKHCSGPCARKNSQQEYEDDIKAFRKFLRGSHKKFLEELQKEMALASKEWKFEEAAKLRDQIRAIESLKKKPLMGNFVPQSISKHSPFQGLSLLKELLEMSSLPRVIEGIDIAHHSGKEAVGSLVCFVDGMPYPEGYRRYRIQGDFTNDDYSMLQEVVRRRFTGSDRKRKLPDVFLVDGGKGQLSSVMSQLGELDIQIPRVISLAKQNEEIFIPEQNTPLPIEKKSAIHHLICYIRDESHRFAQKYHHHLKGKKIRHSRLK